MLIKSLILREKGTTVSFGDPARPAAVYVFTGPKDGPHVCEVGDPEHAETLLTNRPRAFALVDDPISAPEMPEDDDPEEPIEMIDDDVLDAEDIDEETNEPVDLDNTALGVTSAIVAEMGGDPAAEALRAARAAYRDRFGKNPGPKWDVEEIARRLREE